MTCNYKKYELLYFVQIDFGKNMMKLHNQGDFRFFVSPLNYQTRCDPNMGSDWDSSRGNACGRSSDSQLIVHMESTN